MAFSEEKSRKPRKHNFSPSEINILTEKVEVLQSKLTNSITNKRKKQIWENITAAVNAIGLEKRAVSEVREKWKNIHSPAKKEFANYNKGTRKTGGGPAPKQPSETSKRLIELFQDTPSFSGLAGFETNGKPLQL